MSLVRSPAAPEPLVCRVYEALCAGHWLSGARLAAQLGVTRSAVWKAIGALRALGLAVEAVPHRGYHAPAASERLRAERIVACLPKTVAARLGEGRCCWSTGSTNADLLQAAVAPGQFHFLTAEYQTAGRGRRARRWFAPPGGAICLSLAWSFAALPREVGSLSLAMGVCALRALQRSGVQGVALKWPNDLVVGAAKLGGILVELRAEAGGPALVIIGVGLNVALGPLLSQRVRSTGTHPADLVGVSGGPVDRHRLAAQLMAACIEGLEQFEQQGLRPFLAAWREADALAGCRVVVQADQERVHGHARGIDATGALCVQTREGVQRFMTGDVTVRAST